MHLEKFSINGSPKVDYKPITTSFSVNGRNQWVDYGLNNLLPDELLNLNNSPTHTQLLFLKSLLVAGNGFAINESNTKLKQYIEDYNINEQLEKVARNFVRFNGFSLQLIPSKKGQAIIKQIDFSKLRAHKIENPEYVVNPQSYFVSPCWKDYRRPMYNPVEYPAYNLGDNDITEVRNGIHILYHYIESEGQYYYPLPSYKDGMYYILLEAALSKWHLRNVQNGLVPTGILSFPGNPTEEEREETLRNVRNDLQGEDNGGNIIAVFNQGEGEIKFIPISTNNNSDIYLNLKNESKAEICASHSLNSPTLAGIPGGGSIFTNEISTAFRYFERTVIKMYQKPLIKVFSRLFREMDLLPEGETIDIKSLNALEFIYANDLLGSLYTINELREKAGDAPIPQGNQFPNLIKPEPKPGEHPAEPIPPSGLNPRAGDITTGEPKSISK